MGTHRMEYEAWTRSAFALVIGAALVAGCESEHTFAPAFVKGPEFTFMRTLREGQRSLALGGPAGVRIDTIDPQTGKPTTLGVLPTPLPVTDVREADIDGDGKRDVVVTMDDVVGVFIYDDSIGPAPYRPYQSVKASVGNPSNDPQATDLADVNKDGAVDLVVGLSAAPMSRGPDDTCDLDIYLNNGTGGFVAPPIRYTFPNVSGVSRGVTYVSAGQLDATPNPEILLQLGNGFYVFRFTGSALIPVIAATGADFAGTDANFVSQCRTSVFANFGKRHDVGSDGLIDYYAGTNSDVRLYRAIGDRKFAAAQMFPVGSPTITELDCSDLDGDDIADFVATRPGLGGVTVYLGTEAGGLTSAMNYRVGDGIIGAAIAPAGPPGSGLNSPSIVAGLGAEGIVVAIPPAGSGKFFASQSISSASRGAFARLALGDLDDDGYNDVFGSAGSELAFHRNLGDGSGMLNDMPLTYLAPASNVTGLCYVPAGPQTMGARFAIASTTKVLLLFRKTSPTTIAPTAPYFFDDRPPCVGLGAADLTQDGNPEMIVVHNSATSGEIDLSTFVFNAGLGTYVTPSAGFNLSLDKIQMTSEISGPNGAGAYHLGVICKSASGLNDTFGVIRLAPTGGGTYTVNVAALLTMPQSGIGIASADFNDDGDPDYAVLSSGGTAYQKILTNGLGAWETPIYVDMGGQVHFLGIGADRFNADELPDLAFTYSMGTGKLGVMGVLLNEGGGNFSSERQDFLTGSEPDRVIFGDLHESIKFRGRGTETRLSGPEAIVACKGTMALTPQGLVVIPNISDPSAQCVGDLNGDQLVDDADFSIFVVAYNILDCADPAMPAGCPADLNGDGIVEDADFSVFVVAYNALVCP